MSPKHEQYMLAACAHAALAKADTLRARAYCWLARGSKAMGLDGIYAAELAKVREYRRLASTERRLAHEALAMLMACDHDGVLPHHGDVQ